MVRAVTGSAYAAKIAAMEAAAPAPVAPHVPWSRGVGCNGWCDLCNARVGKRHGFNGFRAYDIDPVADGAYVVETNEFRRAVVVAFDPAHHEGWKRYALHVCDTGKAGEL